MNVFGSPRLSNVAIAALLLAGALAVALPARAAGADDAERHRIAEERAAIEARYAARQRECQDRFVVTSCVDDAKAERRHGLDELRARQLKLDEEQRRGRTAERSAELAAKAADDARREKSAPAPREPRPLEPRHETPARPAASTPAGRHDRPVASHGLAKKPGPSESAEQRRENEERHRASFEMRQQQAIEHRQEVLDKAAEREKKGKPPAAPLPVPASVPAR
jgi:hypothetical protein